MARRATKADAHLLKMKFLIERINEINEWRHEQFKSGRTDMKAVDARVLELREAVEKN